jgi:hypothetical protein
MVEKITCIVRKRISEEEIQEEKKAMIISYDGKYLDLDVENLLITVDKKELEKLLEYLFRAFVEKGG